MSKSGKKQAKVGYAAEKGLLPQQLDASNELPADIYSKAVFLAPSYTANVNDVKQFIDNVFDRMYCQDYPMQFTQEYDTCDDYDECSVEDYVVGDAISFGTFQNTAITALRGATADWIIIDDVLPNQNQEKENTMCYDQKSEASLKETKTNYLLRRLSNLRYSKQDELREQFGMNGFQAKTKDELLAGLKRAQINEDAFDKKGDLKPYMHWSEAYLIPAENMDEEGYNAAWKQLDKDYKTTEDEITVLDPTEALQSLRAFEEKTYQ